MSIIEDLKDKKILIWGYGREGRATEDFLKRCCRPASVEIFEGKREEINDESFDLVIKSPGIVMEEENPKYTSQTELFLEEFRDQVIGITGTKGKSTTSAMMYHALKECSGRNVVFLGNIGEPCLNYFEEIDKDTIIVFEMSCHQLAHVKVSPHIALFLNLYEEHLDYYKTMDKYFAAKANITRFQKEGDFFFAGDNVPEIETKASKIIISRNAHASFELSVLGEHNEYNAEFVANVAEKCFGISRDKTAVSLKTFTGLPHRLQYIGEKDGIKYYDDSISTIPNAAIQALESIPDAKTIFLGGMDRGINYDVLIDFIKEHREFNYICSYDSGKRIYDAVEGLPGVYYVKELEAAVAFAGEITPEGGACVLSPASASYGYFKNFEHRGEMFRIYAGL